MESNFRNFFTKVYDKAGYFDKYGDSIMVTFLSLTAFVIIYNYLRIKSQYLPIRKNWDKHKCKPYIIPLAGYIHEKEDPMGFAKINFTECVNDVLSGIVGSFTIPAFTSGSMILDVFSKLGDSVNGIRSLIANILKVIGKIMETILKIIFALLKPIIDILTNIFNLALQSSSLLNIIFNVIQTIIFTFVSFIGIFIRKLAIILGITTATMLALIAIVVGVPFFGLWAIAPLIIVTAAYGVLAYVLAKVIIFSTDVKNIVGSSVPDEGGECDFDPFTCDEEHPEYDEYCCDTNNKKDYPADWEHKCCCFDGNTIFQTIDGEMPIKELKPGMQLKDNSIVNAVMKLSAENETMYNLRGIIVSGSHKVYYENEFIDVCNHPESFEIKDGNEKYKETEIYCLNTSTKKIILNGLVFSDWDEIYLEDIHYLRNKGFIPKTASFEYINEGFHRGFTDKDSVLMNDNTKKTITNVKVGDLLENNNKVVGVVELISGKSKSHKTLHKTSQKHNLETPNQEYNLITEKGIINVNGVVKIDYDAVLFYIFGY